MLATLIQVDFKSALALSTPISDQSQTFIPSHLDVVRSSWLPILQRQASPLRMLCMLWIWARPGLCPLMAKQPPKTLSTNWCSRASLRQRSGRAGRIPGTKGTYWCLMSRQRHSTLPEHKFQKYYVLICKNFVSMSRHLQFLDQSSKS